MGRSVPAWNSCPLTVGTSGHISCPDVHLRLKIPAQILSPDPAKDTAIPLVRGVALSLFSHTGNAGKMLKYSFFSFLSLPGKKKAQKKQIANYLLSVP